MAKTKNRGESSPQKKRRGRPEKRLTSAAFRQLAVTSRIGRRSGSNHG